MYRSDEFPRLSEYLDGLPEGLDSHPRARVSSELVWPVRDLLARSGVELADPLAAIVDGRYQQDWVPEVWGGALLLAARDRLFRDDDAFFEFTEESNEHLAYRPLGRMVLRNSSPNELIARMTQRWSLFHQGTVIGVGDVEREGDREWTPLVLTYPPRLFTRLLIERGSHAFLRQLELARGREPAVRVERYGEEEAWFHLSWAAVAGGRRRGRGRRGA